MNVSRTIQWATPYSLGLILSLAVVAAASFVLLRLASGRAVAPARRPALQALRLLILGILAVVLLNPVWVDRTPGAVEKPKVLYLVDTSQSMALGKGEARWERVVRTIRDTGPRNAQVGVFRFGSRLAAVESPFWNPPERRSQGGGRAGLALADEPAGAGPAPAPTDDDTLLSGSLEGLAGRFGQTPPQAVVVFSDGRARDPERAEAIAKAYGKMKIPVHVLPVGDDGVGGDVAIVSMVVPTLVRKHTQVVAQVFVRSFGFSGQRAELKLVTATSDAQPASILARAPVVLRDGLATYSLTFDTGDQDRSVEALIDPRPGEVSSTNNAFKADLAIDRTKIRVLYLEGANEPETVRQGILGLGGSKVVGAYTPLQEALTEDPDVECTAIRPAGAPGDFSFLLRSDDRNRGFPETPSELFAFDAIILSNVPRESLGDQALAWLDEWVGRRGGGLCMVGGPNSFAAGQWRGTAVDKMLPIELLPTGRDWSEAPVTVTPDPAHANHPIWHLSSDVTQNQAILKTFPRFLGSNRVGPAKSGGEVLARIGTQPAIAVQPYGRGRTMVMSTPITNRWAREFIQSWGEKDNRYSKKYWRNVAYWLSDNSSIGRRRLLAETDKHLYRPGEPVVLRARTFDENSALTLDYRVAVTVEPRSATDVTSDDSPLRRPSAGSAGPLLPWGEEFELTRVPADKSYSVTLPVAQAKSLPSGVSLTQGLRIELTAYENNTQVDSTALDVQILDDPAEQQNPLPDHDLLRRIAAHSKGTVLDGSTDLSAMLDRLPTLVGPPQVKMVPAWSRWWMLMLLIALLTVEWVWRRRVGLA
jgi:uncharacterized membrane protein